MRRIISVMAAFSVMGALMAVSALPVAGQDRTPEGGAVIIDTGCNTGGVGGTPSISTQDAQSVITPTGNTVLTCHFEGPPIQETVVLKGFECGTNIGLTRDSQLVYTKSGKATLTCHINPGN
jgi:hypothetical protein